MAATLRSRPYLAGGAAVAAGALALYSGSRRPVLADDGSSAPSPTLSFPRTMLFSKQLTVTSVEQVNHDTKRITFALPGGSGESSGVPAGGAVLTQHFPAGKWVPVLRPYTPVHDVEQRGVLQLLVKRYPGGRASGHLHELAVGDELTVRGPLPGYNWTPSREKRELVLIAGGAGITPIYSLTRAILADETDRTRVKIIWGVNGERDIVLKKELDELVSQFPDRIEVTYCVSGNEGKMMGEGGKYRKGYIDKPLLQEVIAKLDAHDWGDAKGTKVFFCGPPAMQNAITGRKGVLMELGIDKKATHVF